jgi:hypothetical protein
MFALGKTLAKSDSLWSILVTAVGKINISEQKKKQYSDQLLEISSVLLHTK